MPQPTKQLKIFPVFDGRIHQGKLQIEDTEKVRMARLAAQEKDGEVEISIQRKKRKRSLKQNAAVWGIPVKLIYENTYGQWDSSEDVYHWLEDKFAPKKLIEVGREPRWVRQKIKNLSVQECGEMYLKIQEWAAKELNLDIPDPDKRYWYHKPL